MKLWTVYTTITAHSRKSGVKHDQPIWDTPLTINFRQAKNGAYKKGNKTWKYLPRTLRHVINATLHNSRLWWNNIRKMEGKHITPSPIYHLDDTCVAPEEFVNEQNNFFVNIGGPRISLESLDFPPSSRSHKVWLGEVKRKLNKLNPKKGNKQSGIPNMGYQIVRRWYMPPSERYHERHVCNKQIPQKVNRGRSMPT